MDDAEAEAWAEELTEILELEKDEMRKTFTAQAQPQADPRGPTLPSWI